MVGDFHQHLNDLSHVFRRYDSPKKGVPLCKLLLTYAKETVANLRLRHAGGTAFILGASSNANACVRFITAVLYMERPTKSLMPAIETTLIIDPSFITLAVS